MLVAGTTGRAGPVLAQSATLISMSQHRFAPASITITAGSNVVWQNDEDPNAQDVTHDVVADDLVSWDSDYLEPGQKFSRTFSDPGVYNYLCDLHPDMTGTIVVT